MLAKSSDNIQYYLDTPYKGLDPYTEEDVLFFFGRDDWQRIIIDNLLNSRLTIFYGESGVGKSSLLRAGIANHLRVFTEEERQESNSRKFAVVVFKNWYHPNIPIKFWLIFLQIDCLAGYLFLRKFPQLLDSPKLLDNLLKQIQKAVAEALGLEQNSLILKQRFQEALNKESKEKKVNSSESAEFLQQLQAWSNIISEEYWGSKLLIILDQFEDYFIYHFKTSESKYFLKTLDDARKSSTLNVNFLLAIRSDAYYKLESLKTYISSILDNCLELKHLDKRSAEDAIRKPLARYNCRQTIVNSLKAKESRLTVLTGKSHVGKSFMLKKGVVPYLDSNVEENSVFPVVLFDDWINNPLDMLIKKIKDKINLYLDIELQESLLHLQNIDDILKFWNDYLETHKIEGNILIIFDHFEQYFNCSEVQISFDDAVCQLLTCDNFPVSCLISIRQDNNHLEKLYKLISKFKNKIPAWDEKYLQLSEDCIYIKSFNKKTWEMLSPKTADFENDFLVNNILEKLSKSDQEIGGSQEARITAPYLQIVMTRLWEEKEKNNGLITNKKFGDLGDIKGIVKEYVNTRIRQSQLFSEEDQKIARQILSYFLTPSGGKNLLSHNDLVGYTKEEANKLNLPPELKPDKVINILDKLSDARILSSVGLSSPRYEIYLSQLVPAIQQIRTEHLSYVRSLTIAQRLPAQVLSLLKYKQDDLAALLTLHAYNKLKEDEGVYSLSQVDSAIREILNKHRFSCLFEKPDYNESDLFQPNFWQAAFNPKMKMIAAIRQKGELWLWDLSQSNLRTKSFQIYDDGDNFRNREFLDLPIAFNPDGSLLASICHDGTEKRETVKIWEVDQLMSCNGQSPTPKAKFHLPSKGQIMSVAFQPPSGQIVATVSWQGDVTLWDLNKRGKPVLSRNIETKKEEKENNWIWSLAFSADGNMIAIGGKYGVYLWKLFTKLEFIARKGIIMNLCKDDPKEIFSVTFSQDGKWLAVGAGDRNVYLYQLDKITQPPSPCPLKGHKDEVRAVAFSSDSTRLASASKDQTIRVWNLENVETDSPPETEEILSGHYYGVGSVAFDPKNSQCLISCGWDRTIRIWDLQTEPKIKEFFPENEKHEDIDVISVGFIDDKRFIVVISDNRVLVGDYKSLDQKTPLKEWRKAADAKVSAVAFWPLNNPIEKVAIGSSDNQIEIWEWKEENLVRTFKYPETQNEDIKNINSLAFSPNGEILVLGLANAQNTVYLFDVTQSITELHPLKYTEPVSSICFNSNPKQVILAISNKTGKISLWNLNQITKPCPLIEKPLEQKQIFGFSAPIVFSPDGKSLASGTDHSLIKLWELSQYEQSNFPELKPSENTKFFKLQKSLPSQNFCVTSLAFSFTKDRKWLASGRYDGSIQLWNMNNLDCEPIVLQGHKSQVSSLAFSPDGKKLLSGSFDNTVCLWIVETEELVKKLENNWRRELTKEEQKKFIGIESPR